MIRRKHWCAAALAALALLPLLAATFGRALQDEAPSPALVEDEVRLAVVREGVVYDVTLHLVSDGRASEAQRAHDRQALTVTFAEDTAAGPASSSEGADGPVGAAAYVLTGPTWATRALSWYYDDRGNPGGLGAVSEIMAAGAAAWSGQGNWSFVYQGTTTAGVGGCANSPDGQNTVGWGELSGATLAVTCTWSRRGASGPEFVEFDMKFDPAWEWTAGANPVYDLQSVATHEFGHALGLDHATGNCPGAVMCPTYIQGSFVHALTEDDRAGLRALYGAAATPPPPAPTPVAVPAAARNYRAFATGAARD